MKTDKIMELSAVSPASVQADRNDKTAQTFTEVYRKTQAEKPENDRRDNKEKSDKSDKSSEQAPEWALAQTMLQQAEADLTGAGTGDSLSKASGAAANPAVVNGNLQENTRHQPLNQIGLNEAGSASAELEGQLLTGAEAANSESLIQQAAAPLPKTDNSTITSNRQAEADYQPVGEGAFAAAEMTVDSAGNDMEPISAGNALFNPEAEAQADREQNKGNQIKNTNLNTVGTNSSSLNNEATDALDVDIAFGPAQSGSKSEAAANFNQLSAFAEAQSSAVSTAAAGLSEPTAKPGPEGINFAQPGLAGDYYTDQMIQPGLEPEVPGTVAGPSALPEIRIADQVVEHIDVQQLQQAQQLTLRLRPDDFGRLEIRLLRDQGGLIAQLISDNAVTRELLAQQAADLQQALRDQGFEIVQTEILSDFSRDNGRQQGSGYHQFDQDNSPVQQLKATRSLSLADDARVIRTERIYQNDTGSVDYFA